MNYERLIPLKRIPLTSLGVNIGGSYYGGFQKLGGDEWFFVPLRLNFCVGKNDFYGEAGINFLFNVYKDRFYYRGHEYDKYYREGFWFCHLGLRYQPGKDGLFFRGFVFPIIISINNHPFLEYIGKEYTDYKNRKFFLWGGISIGYSL